MMNNPYQNFFFIFIYLFLGFLNLRGSDIEFTPVFKSYLHIDFSKQKSILYVSQKKLNKSTIDYLHSINCEVKNYQDIF